MRSAKSRRVPRACLHVGPAVSVPIFRAGQIRNQVRLTEAQQRELLVTYERSIYNALREVSDSLIGLTARVGSVKSRSKLVRALTDAVRLSALRYKGGLTAISRFSMRSATCSRANCAVAAPVAGAAVRGAALPCARRRLAVTT